MAQEAEESFEGLAEFALKGLSRLDPGTRAALIEEAAALGIPSERADRLIGRICRRSGRCARSGRSSVLLLRAAVFGSDRRPPAAHANGAAKFSLLRCRHCAGVTELSPVARKAGSARCRHCGASLKWDCPVCKTQRAGSTSARCECGFRQALREPVVRHFEAAQNAFRNFDLRGGSRASGSGPGVCPEPRRCAERGRQDPPEAGRHRPRPAGLRDGAGRRPAGRRPAVAVEAWSQLVDPESPELQAAWSEVARTCAGPSRWRHGPGTWNGPIPSAARDLYRQSLAIAADLPDALAGLKRTPPDPPTALDGQVLGDRIRLSWTPPPPDGLGPLTFVVVRKRGGSLEHPGDGTRIAEVSTCEFDDTHARPATPSATPS